MSRRAVTKNVLNSCVGHVLLRGVNNPVQYLTVERELKHESVLRLSAKVCCIDFKFFGKWIISADNQVPYRAFLS